MITTERIIHCVNPTCSHPINFVGSRVCANCQTPIVYRYIWAIGEQLSKIPVGEIIADRYEVLGSQIWLDNKPGEMPETKNEVADEIIPYLRLCRMRSHLPQVYGFVDSPTEIPGKVTLLENAPINENGKLYPSINEVWEEATPVRQLYWLWQILQLWQPLSDVHVEASLFLPNNLRVQGWCVRLIELMETSRLHTSTTSLQRLAESWQPLIEKAHPSIAEHLQNILRPVLQGTGQLAEISQKLNLLLLSAASEFPLNLTVAGATDIGIEPRQNEDCCFPTNADSIEDPLLPRVSIVCDGIGGHEGGEVASQLAVQSMKLQMRALLTEVALSSEPVPPNLLQQQIEASLRVVNNLICNANNQQKREGTQRMGTTLVMGIQIPQPVRSIMGWDAENSHELYIASIGDSRVYWITRDSCQQLTVDDDVVAREVRTCRSMYRKALQRPDATALTQALGTKEGESLRIDVQRLIIDEDAVLLLCSDGLSDNHLVERSWQDFALPVLNGIMTLEDALYAWIRLANQTNGHDNISLVMTYCRVSPEYIVATPAGEESTLEMEGKIEPTSEVEVEVTEDESQITDSSQALLDLDLELPDEAPISETTPVSTTTQKRNRKRGKSLVRLVGLLALLLGGISLGLYIWWRYNPRHFNQICRQLPPSLQRVCPGEK
ncbi:protein-serine/threonine phosphatase [Calothrix sp. NIES-4101]|nr:protein-serine/threonine phosphatase [Calothrix sp. NIES-4101]